MLFLQYKKYTYNCLCTNFGLRASLGINVYLYFTSESQRLVATTLLERLRVRQRVSKRPQTIFALFAIIFVASFN